MYYAIKSCTLKAHSTYLVTDMNRKLIASIAFWLGFALVSFIYIDIALDILAN